LFNTQLCSTARNARLISLAITPTSHYGQPYSGIEDYELKVSITSGDEVQRRSLPYEC
jgi:hypothetical protein